MGQHTQYSNKATGWTILGLNPTMGNRFISSQNMHSGSRAQPASYSVGTGGSFLGVKQLRPKAEHPPTSSAQVTNEWSCIFTPPINLHGLYRENFYHPVKHSKIVQSAYTLHMCILHRSQNKEQLFPCTALTDLT